MKRHAQIIALCLGASAIGLGCPPPLPTTSQTPSPPEQVPPPEPAPPLTPLDPLAPCELTRPETTPAPGPVFAIVDHVGLVEIGAETSRIRVSSKADHSFTQMEVDEHGALWIGGWHDADLLRLTTSVERFELTRAKGFGVKALAPRGLADVWLVADDERTKWQVMHYDGTRLRHKRKWNSFTREGGYDDNKFVGLARFGDAVYIACWNGLWRRDAEGWALLPLPAGIEADRLPLTLLSTTQGVVAGFGGGVFLHNDEGWHRMPIPLSVRAINDAGLAVSSVSDRSKIQLSIHAPHTGSCIEPSASINAYFLYDIALDQRGRAWVATDSGLSVVRPDGELAAHWGFGELRGLDARIERLVVVGGGPRTLPAPTPAPTWTLVGRLEFSSSGTPVAGRSLRLCSSGFTDRHCAGAPFVRSAMTGPDGRFEFTAVPPGNLAFVVMHSDHTPECDGVFVAEPHFVSPSEDCNGPDRVCDLGLRDECLPFEMPPLH